MDRLCALEWRRAVQILIQACRSENSLIYRIRKNQYTDSTEKKHFTVAEGRLVRLSLLFEQQVQLNVELNLLRRKLENI